MQRRAKCGPGVTTSIEEIETYLRLGERFTLSTKGTFYSVLRRLSNVRDRKQHSLATVSVEECGFTLRRHHVSPRSQRSWRPLIDQDIGFDVEPLDRELLKYRKDITRVEDSCKTHPSTISSSKYRTRPHD